MTPKNFTEANEKEASNRIARLTAAARVNAMEHEKAHLQKLHSDLLMICRSIGDRIDSLNRQIAAEKASVPVKLLK